MRKSGYLRILSFIVLIVLVEMGILPAVAPGQEAVLRAKSQPGISYMTGGVGLEEREAMKKEARNYNLWLEFAISAGNYLSGVKVRIKDAKGNVVLEEKSTGPWLLASLPEGKYLINAKIRQQGLTTSVDVPAAKKITLTWK